MAPGGFPAFYSFRLEAASDIVFQNVTVDLDYVNKRITLRKNPPA